MIIDDVPWYAENFTQRLSDKTSSILRKFKSTVVLKNKQTIFPFQEQKLVSVAEELMKTRRELDAVRQELQHVKEKYSIDLCVDYFTMFH